MRSIKLKYFTDEMKQRIKKLLLEYSDFDNVRLERSWGDELKVNSISHKIFYVEMPLKFPYGIEIGTRAENYKNKLRFHRGSLNHNKQDEVNDLFLELTKTGTLTKTDYEKLVDLIDLDGLVSKTDTNYLNLLVYHQSFEKSNLKQYTGQPFGSGELRRFLKENKQFFIVRNWISQSKWPMALVTENDDYIKLAYTDYIKLFPELEDCEITNQINDLLL